MESQGKANLTCVWGSWRAGRCWAEAELDDAKRETRVSVESRLVTCSRAGTSGPTIPANQTHRKPLFTLIPSNANLSHAPPPIPHLVSILCLHASRLP